MRTILLTVLTILAYIEIHAQTKPTENDTLNYRIAGFTVPQHKDAVFYRFEIARGINNNHVYFKKNLISKTKSEENRAIITLPSFGETYTWRVTYLDKKKKTISQTPFYHFTTGKPSYADTSLFRLRVIDNKLKNDSLWILADGNKCMYDLQGNPVWYLPAIPGIIEEDGTIRDLKLTKDNTFTFVANYGCYEIDYNGKVLWHTPDSQKVSADGSVFFHHEFTKLPNGHYMAAGKEDIEVEVPSYVDTALLFSRGTIYKSGSKFYKKIPGGVLLEYDSSGKIVWQLRLGQYFSDSTYFENQLPSGNYVSETHFNSFYLDNKNRELYLGFRNINRILKVSYPDGKLLAEYNGISPGGDVMFKGQHHVHTDSAGNIYIFNNGTEKAKKGLSTVLILKSINDSTLVKKWEFPCDIDNNALPYSPAGGSEYKINDSCLLVAMGSAGRIFIVTPSKKLIWNAVGETKNNTPAWHPFIQYRAYPVEGYEKIKQLIFSKR